MNKRSTRAILIMVSGLLLAPPAGHASLVFNGDFEQPNLGGTGNFYGVGSTAVTGWTVLGNGGVTIHHVNQVNLLWPNNNSQFLDLSGNTGGGGVVSTPIATVVGQSYRVTFDAVNGSRWFNAGSQNNPYYGAVLTLQASGAALATYSSGADLPPGNLPVPPAGNLIPVILSYSFVATTSMTTLTFMDVTGTDSNAGWIDNVSLVAVPEPTTIVAGALLLLPFGASIIRIVRKNRAA